MKCQIRPDPHRFLEEGFKYILGMILTLLLTMSKEGNKKSIHLKITKNSIDFLYKKTMNC